MNATSPFHLNGNTASSRRRERFLFAANEGKVLLTAAVAALPKVPAAGLMILYHWSYQVAAALAQEMTELTGAYVPVRLHGTRKGVSGEHLLALLRQVWEAVARSPDECVVSEPVVMASDADIVPVPQCV